MRPLFIALIVCLAFVLPAFAQELWIIPWQVANRGAYVDFPQSRAGQKNLPVVIALHGWGLSAKDMRDSVTQFHILGDSVGFITVHPEALQLHWNSGISDNPAWPVLNVDDVGFISKIIDSLISRFAIDTQRVYCCGSSNGGIMTLKLAAQLSHRIAAVASDVGVMTRSIETSYTARRPIPVLMINGTADLVVPYYGGAPGWYSVDQTIGFWRKYNDCLLPPDTLSLPHLDAADSTRVIRYIYRSSINPSIVELLKVVGGGHVWPSYNASWQGIVGATKDIKASTEIWNFLQQFSLGTPADTYVHHVSLDRKFARPGIDSISITAVLANPLKQSAVVTATVGDTLGVTLFDSFKLYNDGLHGDGSSGDSLWGCRFRAPSDEGIFNIGVVTRNNDQGTVVRLPYAQRFYTSGPIVYKGWTTTTTDTVPRPGTVLRMRVRIANAGKSASIKNVIVSLSTLDTMVFIGSVVPLSYGEVAAGQEMMSPGNQALKIQSYCPANTKVRLLMSISTNGLLVWTDTISIMVQPAATKVSNEKALPAEYALSQNYPNPFNPSTTIAYDLPRKTMVSLRIFNALGQVVATLIDGERDSGRHQEFWVANIPSGMYFYRLQAGDYVETMKMILIR